MDEKPEYILDITDEMTEEKIKNIPEAEKKLCRFFIEHNPEKKVIEIRPGSGNCIQLHGIQDAQNFIKSIENQIHEVRKLQ